MYTHILLPTDGSERSSRAIEAGVRLAKALNARVTGLFIIEPTYIHEVDKVQDPRAEQALSEVLKQAESCGVACETVSLMADTPENGIIRFASDNACDLIVMGTHGRSRVGKLLLGSAAATVLADCEIPVLLYR